MEAGLAELASLRDVSKSASQRVRRHDLLISSVPQSEGSYGKLRAAFVASDFTLILLQI